MTVKYLAASLVLGLSASAFAALNCRVTLTST
jgi:hypothetical protein